MARQLSAKRPENLKGTIKKLLGYMGNHKFLFLLVAILTTISALSGLFGTYMLKPIVNNYIVPGNMKGLFYAVLFMGAVYLAGVLSSFGYTQLMVRAAQKITAEIREDLFRHIQKLPLKYFDTRTHGDIMSRFTNDVDTVSDALNNSFAMVIQSFIQIVGTLTLIFILNWRLSLIVFACYILMFAYIRYSGKKSKYYFNYQQKYLGELNGYIEEMTAGQKVVKVFNHEGENIEQFRQKNGKLKRAAISALTYSGTMIPMVVSISYINYTIVTMIGAFMALRGWTDIGSLASYLVFVRQTAMPINQFTMQSNFLLAALAGAERVFETMEEEPETDKGKVTLVYAEETEDGSLRECGRKTGIWAWKAEDGALTRLRGDVQFKDVDFGYNRDHLILKKISLYAKPGQKIAFVGSTGAGKTTITNLINRFYDIDGGSLTYDGIDVRNIKKDALRSSLGMVLQDTHLFTGTIADNIRYGRLDATMEEVVEAAKLANADSFISRLPKGYDTMVTADGSNLSQGQRQLLAIARAAVADPPVLILDEATSSIDTRTERLIEKGMDRLMEGRTVFVIAHRLSTVRNSNAIMVLEQGKIIERGDHEDLIGQRGIYYQLYNGMFELA
ncbi:ABC transporter ATP-binding protein [[Clostridium] symbiosum]|uniref:ABC transporter ATP-binding protein n=1 Tax=Clostridium symbiosum TaxID=1512 RepID=UPI001D083E82|nr:ABC transporter ATP-binding protein [[Clostridium] symbiosum]MCB6608304.1 ABC transporter ATP-binding protein/permease [[Clostridium] symbiosum]MCB6932854.1 ABC transporter ATP-binding protein/permease [[Clostridium] symbiosum]